MGCALMAGVACFESVRHWLLYEDIAVRWGLGLGITTYLSRGESLRASASSGHPLALGYLLAVAFGFWLYLKDHLDSNRMRITVTALFCLGMMAAYSRGPWLCAVVIYFAFAALGPQAASKLTRAIGAAILAAVAILLTPLGARVVSVLPFLGGTVNSDTIEYRSRLLTRSWDVIKQSPWFGDPLAIAKLQDLRQGQGIVDFVNAYVELLLSNGFVGLSLFMAFVLCGLFSMRTGRLQPRQPDSDLAKLGASIGACIIGTLIFIADGSFGSGVERMFYAMVALAVSYSMLVRSNKNASESLTTVL
jgi:O-antigen ligase